MKSVEIEINLDSSSSCRLNVRLCFRYTNFPFKFTAWNWITRKIHDFDLLVIDFQQLFVEFRINIDFFGIMKHKKSQQKIFFSQKMLFKTIILWEVPFNSIDYLLYKFHFHLLLISIATLGAHSFLFTLNRRKDVRAYSQQQWDGHLIMMMIR